MRQRLMFALLLIAAAPNHDGATARPAAAWTEQEPAPTKSPFAGVWIANLSKSKPDPNYQFKSVTLHLVVSRDSVTLTSRVLTAAGEEQRLTETFRTDGSETPGTLSPGITHVARWVGPHVLVTTAHKDGRLIGLITYDISADGRILTARSSILAEHVIVFERAEK